MENNVKKEKIEWTPNKILFLFITLSFVIILIAGCISKDTNTLILGCILGLFFFNEYWRSRMECLEARIDELLEELRAYPEISDDDEYYL